MAARRLLLLLALPLLAATPAVGESLGFFAHSNADGDWLSFAEEDANATASSTGFNALVQVVFPIDETQEPGAASWRFPLQPELAGDLDLDAAGLVRFNVTFSSRSYNVDGTPVPGAGRYSFDLRLLQGETVVASAAKADVLQNGTGFVTYSFEAAPNATRLVAGEPLEWHIKVAGPGTGFVLGLGNATGGTNVTLPRPAPAPAAPAASSGPATITRTETLTTTVTATTTVTHETTVTSVETLTLDQAPADAGDKPLPAAGLVTMLVVVAMVAVVRRRLS